jgi:hypothetical protein
MINPTFVIGFPRSGTTLLADLLGRHSQIAVPPETRFAAAIFEHYRPSRFPKPASPSEYVEQVLKAYPRLQDVDVNWEDVVLRMEAGKRRGCGTEPAQLFNALLYVYAKEQGKPHIVEKSPVHLLYADVLLRWFPDARFVWIIRDGRDAVLSLMRMPWAHSSLLLHAAEWNYRMDRAERFRAANPDQCYTLRYEDLLTDPETTLYDLCAFVGVSYEASMLDPTLGGSSVPVWEQAWKGAVTQRLDPTRVAAWRRAPLRRQHVLQTVMGPILRRWGYETRLLGLRPIAQLVAAPLQAAPFSLVRSVMHRSKSVIRKLGLPVPFSRAAELARLRNAHQSTSSGSVASGDVFAKTQRSMEDQSKTAI